MQRVLVLLFFVNCHDNLDAPKRPEFVLKDKPGTRAEALRSSAAPFVVSTAVLKQETEPDSDSAPKDETTSEGESESEAEGETLEGESESEAESEAEAEGEGEETVEETVEDLPDLVVRGIDWTVSMEDDFAFFWITYQNVGPVNATLSSMNGTRGASIEVCLLDEAYTELVCHFTGLHGVFADDHELEPDEISAWWDWLTPPTNTTWLRVRVDTQTLPGCFVVESNEDNNEMTVSALDSIVRVDAELVDQTESGEDLPDLVVPRVGWQSSNMAWINYQNVGSVSAELQVADSFGVVREQSLGSVCTLDAAYNELECAPFIMKGIDGYHDRFLDPGEISIYWMRVNFPPDAAWVKVSVDTDNAAGPAYEIIESNEDNNELIVPVPTP